MIMGITANVDSIESFFCELFFAICCIFPHDAGEILRAPLLIDYALRIKCWKEEYNVTEQTSK